jgi:hypothetical protein
MYPDTMTALEDEEQKQLFRAMERNFPEIISELKPTIRQLREAEAKYGISPAAGQSRHELPILSVRGDSLNKAVLQFSRKLALALFYKHTGTILPQAGRIALKWYSNLQIGADAIPKEAVGVLSQFPQLFRNNSSLGDQFFYRLGVVDTREIIGFLAFFRQSFAILGIVATDGSKIQSFDQPTQLGPYRWLQ